MVSKPNLPSALARAYLDKQVLSKSPGAPSTGLGDELAQLTRLHLAVRWDDFDDEGAGLEKAQTRLADLEEAAKGKLKALARQAAEVATLATKFGVEAKKSGKSPKEALTAIAAIAKAAQDYGAELDECIAGARKALAAGIAKQTARQKSAAPASDAKPGAESKSARFVRTRALDAIRALRKPLPGAKPVLFVVVQGKTSVTTFIGPSVGPTQEKILRSLIPTEAPFRTFKDPQGQMLWENNALTFVSDRLPAGLSKKMQMWLKAILKLNLRVRVRRTNGEVEETDGDDLPLELPGSAESGASVQGEDEGALQARLALLAPEIKAVLSGPPSEFESELRALIARFKAYAAPGGKQNLGAAVDVLDEIDAALEERGGAGDGEEDGDAARDVLATWQAACAEVRSQIRRLEAEIVKAKDANSTRAVIQLESVVKNLAGSPATQRQIDEIETWLRNDEMIERIEQPNPWELPVEVRTTLLPLLPALKARLPA